MACVPREEWPTMITGLSHHVTPSGQTAGRLKSRLPWIPMVDVLRHRHENVTGKKNITYIYIPILIIVGTRDKNYLVHYQGMDMSWTDGVQAMYIGSLADLASTPSSSPPPPNTVTPPLPLMPSPSSSSSSLSRDSKQKCYPCTHCFDNELRRAVDANVVA